MDLIRKLIKEVEEECSKYKMIEDGQQSYIVDKEGYEIYWFGKWCGISQKSKRYENGKKSFSEVIDTQKTTFFFFDKQGKEITQEQWLEINPQYKEKPINLKDLLKRSRVVEFDYCGVGTDFRLGVVKYSESEIETADGTHKINWIDDKLVDTLNTKIIRIYDNTINGLELIWDRARDYVEPVDEIDWSKVEVDTKILVRRDDTEEWTKRYFSKFMDGNVYAWSGGATSFTVNKHDYIFWEQAKLYDGE